MITVDEFLSLLHSLKEVVTKTESDRNSHICLENYTTTKLNEESRRKWKLLAYTNPSEKILK